MAVSLAAAQDEEPEEHVENEGPDDQGEEDAPQQPAAAQDTELNSEDEDDEEGSEDDLEWNLGFVEPASKPTDLLRHRFPSKVGGRPAWLDPLHLPSRRQLSCSSSGRLMQFLLQVYAPAEASEGGDDAFHRAIFLFVSPEGHRLGAPGAVRAYRCQLPRSNPFYGFHPASSSQLAPQPLKGADVATALRLDPWAVAVAEVAASVGRGGSSKPSQINDSKASSPSSSSMAVAKAGTEEAPSGSHTNTTTSPTSPKASPATPDEASAVAARSSAATASAAQKHDGLPEAASGAAAAHGGTTDGVRCEAASIATASVAGGSAATAAALGGAAAAASSPNAGSVATAAAAGPSAAATASSSKPSSQMAGRPRVLPLPPNCPALFPELELIVEPEELGPAGEEEAAKVERLLQEYRARVAEEGELDDQELPPDVVSGLEGHIGAERRHFANFQARLAASPDQVLRYCWSERATPLWPRPSPTPRPGSIPPCGRCGAARRFEFQVLPTLLNYLQLDEGDPKALDFGTLAVYTCSASCRLRPPTAEPSPTAPTSNPNVGSEVDPVRPEVDLALSAAMTGVSGRPQGPAAGASVGADAESWAYAEEFVYVQLMQ